MSAPLPSARWARQVGIRGRVLPAPQGRTLGRGKLAPQRAFFEDLIAQAPDIVLFDLRDALADAEGVHLGHASIAAVPRHRRAEIAGLAHVGRIAPRVIKGAQWIVPHGLSVIHRVSDTPVPLSAAVCARPEAN